MTDSQMLQYKKKVCVCGGRDRHRERDRQTETQRPTHRDRQTDRRRQRDREKAEVPRC